ncbi:uncharacterized protein [Palaemon carinicauda]|uniref:uncharacterized protein n=1 Tax=Palaemon carinicauda TaxID=392227 RepID=UPI0035B5B37F
MVAMAKSKGGNGRAFADRKKNLNNNDRNKKNLENGLYVHSSPPKALNSNNGQGSATIRDYIRAGAIDALEEVVLQGQGTKLVNQPATDQKVRNFLKTVPSYMSKIDLIHDAVEKGNLRDLKALLDRRKLARSKDAQGVGLLHKAVVHDHRAIVDYLIADYPETLDVTDHNLSASRRYQVLETLQEVPEDQCLERLPPTQAPPSSPTVIRSFQPKVLELCVGTRPNRNIDTAESKPVKGAIKSSSGGRKVDGLLEMARLNLMEGLELEVADWSEDDANTCYENFSSPEEIQNSAQGEREVFSPELSSTINKLLSRGRSGRLPRLSTPMSSPEVAGNKKSVTRLIDHGQCVGPSAMYPPLLNRTNLAYETHLQRLGRIRRRRPIENDEKQIPASMQRKPLKRPPLLPGIQRKPQSEKQGQAKERPLTPTPSGTTLSAKQRWRKLNPRHSNTIKDHLIAERLHDMFKNLSDSDHENDNLDSRSATDPSTHDSGESNSNGSSSGISPAFDRTSSARSMEDDSGVGSPGNEENLFIQELDNLNLSILFSNNDGGKKKKQSQKVSFIPSAVKRPQKIVTQGIRPTRIYRSNSDGQKSLKFNSHRSKIPVLQRARSEGDLFSPLVPTKQKVGSFINRSSTTSKKSVNFDSSGPPFSPEDLSEIPETSDINLYMYAQAAPSVQKYIRWLARRIIGETFADLKNVYDAAIKKHNSRKEILDIVYDHDVDYWAKVIVERVCKRVETSILTYNRDGTLNFR